MIDACRMDGEQIEVGQWLDGGCFFWMDIEDEMRMERAWMEEGGKYVLGVTGQCTYISTLDKFWITAKLFTPSMRSWKRGHNNAWVCKQS